jgi:hypothetical protein
LKNAQRALSEVMRGKEGTAAGKKRKQAVMDEILTPCPCIQKNWMQRLRLIFMKMALLSIQLEPEDIRPSQRSLAS